MKYSYSRKLFDSCWDIEYYKSNHDHINANNLIHNDNEYY